jgi:hypothetical protein
MERRARCHRGRHAVAYTVTKLFMQNVEFPLAARLECENVVSHFKEVFEPTIVHIHFLT